MNTQFTDLVDQLNASGVEDIVTEMMDTLEELDEKVDQLDQLGHSVAIAKEDNERYYRMIAKEDEHQTVFPVCTEGFSSELIW